MTDPMLDPARIAQLHAYSEGGLRAIDPLAIATASMGPTRRAWSVGRGWSRWAVRLVAVALLALVAIGMAVAVAGLRAPTPPLEVRVAPLDVPTPAPDLPTPPPEAQTGPFKLTGGLRPGPGHMATLLEDGMVLIIGDDGYRPWAWLWDSASGVFTETGRPAARHGFGVAARLPDGRVLVAGGGGADAEIFDPRTGLFDPTGSMLVERGTCHCGVGYLGVQMPHAATLQDGRVFVIGGQPTSGVADIYDPETGTFTQTPIDTRCDRNRVLPVALATGDVLVKCLDSAWLYHPQTDTLTQTGSPATTSILEANLLVDGRVLFTGHGLRGSTDRAEVFDPETRTFQVLKDPTNPLTAGDPGYTGDPGETLSDGRVLFIDDATARLFDPTTDTFSTVDGGLLQAHGDVTTTRLDDGRVLIVGMTESDTVEYQELFEPSVLP